MKIFINATTCVVGGGVQVASTFIRHAIRYPSGHRFYFAVSPAVMANIASLLPAEPTNVAVLSPSPARNFRGRVVRNRLLRLEAEFQPDIVFSTGAPSYMKFKTQEAAFFADGWVSHPTSLALNNLPFFGRIEKILARRYKAFWLTNTAYFQVEAEVCKRGLIQTLGVDGSRIQVIPNSFSDVFGSQASSSRDVDDCKDGVFRVFTLANPYPHKNLLIIPEVAAILGRQDPSRDYRFIVTLPEKGSEVRRFWNRVNSLNVTTSIENAGPLTLEQLPDWYRKSDVVFLPTLLETFSATYPEAMCMGKPIVTTDLDFAHNICGDAAMYYSPLSAESAARAIVKIAGDSDVCDMLIRNGYTRLREFPGPQEKYQMQIKWLEMIVGSRMSESAS